MELHGASRSSTESAELHSRNSTEHARSATEFHGSHTERDGVSRISGNPPEMLELLELAGARREHAGARGKGPGTLRSLWDLHGITGSPGNLESLLSLAGLC